MENQSQVQNETENSNLLLYILGTVVIILGSYIGYVYASYNLLKNGVLEKKYVLKNDVTFDMLNSYEKSRYVDFYEHTDAINALNKKIRNLENTTTKSDTKNTSINSQSQTALINKLKKDIENLQNSNKILNENKNRSIIDRQKNIATINKLKKDIEKLQNSNKILNENKNRSTIDRQKNIATINKLKKDIEKLQNSNKILNENKNHSTIDVEKHTEVINRLKKEITKLQTINKEHNTPTVVEVEKIVEKIVEVEKQDKENTKKINKDFTKISKKKEKITFDTYTCNNMLGGSIEISNQCKKELYKFLDQYKNSRLFEVIGAVDENDFNLMNTLRDVYGEPRIKELAKYAQLGLAKQRVTEAKWLVGEYLGETKNIDTVGYTIQSKGIRGFVIRAYK